jgi:hypothetical protein
MPSLSTLTEAIQFIQQVEQTYPNVSAYEIANRLRGHTKASYNTKFWTIATGFRQDFVFPNLDATIPLAGELTDFGHLIAALSDQINQPGLVFSDLTKWTSDHTSWAGDLGSAIVTYTQQPKQFPSVAEALQRFASDSDQSANVAAYVIGQRLNQASELKVSQAIAEYNNAPIGAHVTQFVRSRFGDTDPAPEIRRLILAYLNLAADSGLFGWLKGLLGGRFAPKPKYTEREIEQGIQHFLGYLQRKSQVRV